MMKLTERPKRFALQTTPDELRRLATDLEKCASALARVSEHALRTSGVTVYASPLGETFTVCAPQGTKEADTDTTLAFTYQPTNADEVRRLWQRYPELFPDEEPQIQKEPKS